MVIKYNMEIKEEVISEVIVKITNQIFKLLPCREEGGDWQSSLRNIIMDLVGMSNLLCGQVDFFLLLSKLEAMRDLTEDDDFVQFRRLVFESLGCCNEVKKNVELR